MNKARNNLGFVRVAAAVPPLAVGDIEFNTSHILKQIKQAQSRGVQLVVFPELSLTGYTMGDLFQQRTLLESTQEALIDLAQKIDRNAPAVIVGLPLEQGGKLFNCAAVIAQGKVAGIIPKTYIPGYKEFYEERWFASARDLTVSEIKIKGQKIPIGTDILFTLGQAVLGVEICEDVWTPLPPSTAQSLAGATIIANISASNDLVGKADYRRSLIVQQSARLIAGYIYTSSGVHESTTDIVFGGHGLIAENGGLLAESERFQWDGSLTIADIDLEHLAKDRMATTSFGESIHELKKDFRVIDLKAPEFTAAELVRRVDPHPFVPSNPQERDKRAQEIFSIQSIGLAKRAHQSKTQKFVIGLSGGLDSTLAFLVAVRSCNILGIPLKNLHAITMPGFATTSRTKSNAVKLAHSIGATLEEIDITKGASQHLSDIKQDISQQDVTFENTQARYRTMLLMSRANQMRGIVVGTGDLSEIALGWCTFTGDQISHYNVNASIPKTLVKYLVQWASEQKEFAKAKKYLKDILDTPISPELVKAKGKEISQKTEDIIGPYELHDFFLYHFIRWGTAPQKILVLAEHAFGQKYPRATIQKWLKLFITRFFGNQWKRSVMPDGPKVGSISLSPRGDWRMPSDADVKLWLKNL